MNQSAEPIRILLLETDAALTAPAVQILQDSCALQLFQLTVVSTLAEAFRETNKQSPDLFIMDLDPTDDVELAPLKRLHQYSSPVPIIVLLKDQHQKFALNILQKGAQGYLLESQLQTDSLPVFLIRTIEHHAAQKAMRESEGRFRLLVENASDVILILDEQAVISYAGPSTKHILDYHPNDLTTRNALDFIHRDDRSEFLKRFEEAFQGGGIFPSMQFRFRRPLGTWVHMEGKGRITPDPSGRAVCILNSHDVSHRVKLEEELRTLSFRDELTGLHNRRSFTLFLQRELKTAGRNDQKPLHLLFIDLDGFKNINDTLGHKMGDHALVEASRLLTTTFRDADLVARLGGDEFAVLLTDAVENAPIEAVKSRLFGAIDEWNAQEERNYRLAMSVGVVQHNHKGNVSSEDLLRQADELMYQQKREKKRGASV